MDAIARYHISLVTEDEVRCLGRRISHSEIQVMMLSASRHAVLFVGTQKTIRWGYHVGHDDMLMIAQQIAQFRQQYRSDLKILFASPKLDLFASSFVRIRPQ